jgi:predicted metal-dependent phosphoesterase TrpH
VAKATVRADLHSHTHWSSDCSTPYKAIVAACQRRGIDVLAITDHNRIEGALELAEQKLPIQIVVGEEVRTTEGEIIGLFLRDWIPPRLSPEETIAEIKRQGGVVYVPHPFDAIRRGVILPQTLERIASSIDAVEVLNARLHAMERNQRAVQFADERKLLKGAGSDAHTAYEIGRAGVEMPAFTDAASFKEALRRATVFGRPSHPIVHAASSWAKVRKRYLPSWKWI